MIISNALKEFKEKYDREAIESIVNFSKDKTLYGSTFKGFNLTEALSTFKLYIEGYVQYCIESTTDIKKGYDDKVILENTESFLNNKSKNILFAEMNIQYNEAPEFIQNYVESIDILTSVVNSNQSILLESDGNLTNVGHVLEFAETFLDRMNERFYPMMESLLQGSGYYSRKQLRQQPKQEEVSYSFFL